MDICNTFIGCSKFLGVYPVLYDSKIMDAPFRKAKFFMTRHIVFIILTIFALITKFQTDLLFMIVVTFYLLLMCTYGLVFNISNFDNKRGLGLINFFILTLTIIVYRLFLCWVVCHGASSIDVEIQLFRLQCKNRENPFNIFGMFAIGKSFMFMMLTTIISYIAVIIQFTYEAQAGLNGTLIISNNNTNASGL
ncbi:hypothetical protein LSTR_LSTR001329 [Laodelphax striatellus]|uniref:Gustatory receptor n=1 Tax=Laodelphax striatellus TaxID=195883 RepID=A0A482XGV2_LAOST|nr:hypothetical protein LSTR_LSTR001329 [Laodelphax striatellus]